MMTVIGPLLVLAIVIAFRLRRRAPEKPLSARFLWLGPMLCLAAVAVTLIRHPPMAEGWALALLGLGLGAASGWVRGRLFALRIDPGSGEVLRRRSRAAVLLLAGIVAVRFLANLWTGPGAAQAGANSAALLFTDFMLGFVLGLLAATKVEIAVRARRLLASQAVERGGASA